jgi:hypothetical protein
MTEPAPKVFAAIAAVMADLGKDGIAKDRSNQQQGYKFRGIDDVYNALSPVLSRHNLCMLPRILTRDVTERQTQKGSALFYVVVEAEFDLICSEDGSKHTIRTFGEAMDSADKATNKAMSAAYKYAAMQAFAIPTEGDNDADSTTHVDVAPRSDEEPKQLVKVSREAEKQMRGEVDACATVDELKRLWHNPKFQTEVQKLHRTYREGIIELFNERIAFLSASPAAVTSKRGEPPDFTKLEPNTIQEPA